MRRLIFLFAFLAANTASAEQCNLSLAFQHSTFDGTRSVYGDERSLYFRDVMRINTDGAPTSYHPDDPFGSTGKAINTICNGVGVRLPSGEAIPLSQCSRLVMAFNQARDHWGERGRPKVDFYAIATKNGVPCINQEAPYKGYYVSTTALVADAGREACDQKRWLNSLEVPFVIFPGAKSFKSRGVGLRDIAVLYNRKTDVLAYAVVGDQGPAKGLSEGSIALAKTLTKRQDEPKTRKQTYGYNVQDVAVVLLPQAQASPPFTTASIAEAGQGAFERWGGKERLLSCLSKPKGP